MSSEKSFGSGWNSSGPTVSEVGEDALISVLAKPSDNPWVRVHNGDDATVVDPRGALVVMSVDAVLENQHFKREWISPGELSSRAFAVSASDLSAMGVSPDWALLSLVLPADILFRDFEDLVYGLTRFCVHEKIELLGGNLTRGTQLGLHLTVGGFANDGAIPLTRSGARVGDQLWLTGSPGRAAAGRALLGSDLAGHPSGEGLEKAWKCPPKRWNFVKKLAAEMEIHAAIDISDGLALDCRRLGYASGLGTQLDLGDSVIDERMLWASQELESDPFHWVLGGGEDYEVLIAISDDPPDWAIAEGLLWVGQVQADASSHQIYREGAPYNPGFSLEGWDPFSR